MIAASLGLFLIAHQVPVDQPPRLRTRLANGAIVLVERVPSAKGITLGLFLSSKGTRESVATHGYRHLLEHLMARGASGEVDLKLETKGAFLRASTTRDAIAFEFDLPPSSLQLGLEAVEDILRFRVSDSNKINREVRVLSEESALRSPESLASEAAWKVALGADGLDPFGSDKSFAAVDMGRLERVHRETLVGSNAVVVVAGNVDLDDATKRVAAVLNTIPAQVGSTNSEKSKAGSDSTTNPVAGASRIETTGSYRAVSAPGWREPGLAARLAVGFGIASEVPGARLTYTPTGGQGLVMVGVSKRKADFGPALATDPAILFNRGRSLAERWVRQSLQSPTGLVSLRGALLVGASDLRPETILENLQSLEYPMFLAALNDFKSNAIQVEGLK